MQTDATGKMKRFTSQETQQDDMVQIDVEHQPNLLDEHVFYL